MKIAKVARTKAVRLLPPMTSPIVMVTVRAWSSSCSIRGPSIGRLTSAAFMMASSMAMAGCAGRPQGVLMPVALAAPGTSSVEMLVATTRRPTTLPGVMFTGERGRLAFADIAISIPPDGLRKMGEIQWPRALPGNPATDFVVLKAREIDARQTSAWTDKALTNVPLRRVLVFVHGFNNRFEEAVYRYAQIIHDSKAPVVPVLFTWPSRGSVLAYGYDHESASYSRDALERVLRTLAQDPHVGEISILAHSMGNWLTLETLRQMAIRNGRIDPKIKNVMLAAPDVDVDVFERQFADIGPNDAHVTLFLSQDDRALSASSRLWGGPRLGAIDPSLEPLRSTLAANKITVVDLTKLEGSDGLNHAKFSGADVVGLIGQRLVEGQAISEPAGTGLSDRLFAVTTNAAATVGSAAGLIVATPAMVIDPEGRATYGDRIDAFGNALVDTARSGVGILPIPGR